MAFGGRVAFRNLDLWEVLHGRILGFGRLAGVTGFACFGGTSIATRRGGFWSDEELKAHLFGFGLISL